MSVKLEAGHKPNCTAEKYVAAFLEQLLAEGSPDTLSKYAYDENISERVASLKAEIISVKERISYLIDRQTELGVTSAISDFYSQRIASASEQLEILRHNLDMVQRQTETRSQPARRSSEYEILVKIGLEAFWQQDNTFIHQVLSGLMGNLRFVVQTGEIIGIEPHKRRG